MPKYTILSTDEAADIIANGQLIGFSGFTYAGSPKAVPEALARRAKAEQEGGKPFKIRVLSGASIGDAAENSLAMSGAISWRAPYQSATEMRKKINQNEVSFMDMHLSEVAQDLRYGFFGDLDLAVIEASAVTSDGKIHLTSGIGNAPVFLQKAKKVIIELNSYHNPRVAEFADIIDLDPPPNRSAVPLNKPLDRVGVNFVKIDPAKIAGIVETNIPDTIDGPAKDNPLCAKIADNVVKVLLGELRAGRIPPNFLPLQSGVGNINNAVMKSLGEHDEIPDFMLYSEVIQESVIPLMEKGKILGASAASLTISAAMLEHVYQNMDFFSRRIVLRPQEISNHPGLIRHLGVIALNVGLEFDIYGHANSTHICGTSLMNAIGGSGDFERNAYLSVFMAPSIAKGGKISSIVPMCTHVDHSEHSVKIIVTEQGVADLRCLSPGERAESIIENCAHPLYRDYLRQYLAKAKAGGGHIHHDLGSAFDLHRNLLTTGQMLPL